MHKIRQCGWTLQIIVNFEYMYLLAYAVSEEASVLEAQVYQSSNEIGLVYNLIFGNKVEFLWNLNIIS